MSAAPFESLNLGRASGDDPRAVERNLAVVAEAMGTDQAHVVSARQVHAAEVCVVTHPGEPVGEADALVTTTPEVLLCIRAADCVPVLLADPAAGVIGAAHAGRTGLAAGVVSAVVDAMRTIGAQRITAWVGPHICGACYEVPDGLRTEVSEGAPAAFATTRWGTAGLDLGAGVRSELRHRGCAVVDVGRCTYERDELYSYRREGVRSGRQGGLIKVRR